MNNVTYLPWSDEQAAQLRATSQRMVATHDWAHPRPTDVDNCGRCALLTYTDTDAPNYAGWLRTYVQFGRPVPRQHYDTEVAYALAENRLYHEALMRDIATFGIKFTDGGAK